MKVPFEKVLEAARKYQPEMVKFLRDMVRLPSESCEEKAVILRIKEEMEKVGFDKVVIDPMGNILGYVGHGSHLIGMDAHIDTVGIGEIKNWTFDPYEGFEDDIHIGGRGASDQEGGMASMVYAAKIIKELGLEDDYTLVITGTVQEEDCDGLCWQYIIEEDKVRPEFVLITEPTSCRIYRGHRGRMEIKVATRGISCHGSAPERGENAIYKMADIIKDVEKLNDRLKDDAFLGKGTVTVSQIFHKSPSRCAVADGCWISLDRRLTDGETYQSALKEIEELPSVKAAKAEVTMYDYERASYTGLVYPTKAFFPTWVIPESHILCRSMKEGYEGLFKKAPVIDKWTFSTNGVSIMGRYGIECIGFGPGDEKEAHAPNEKTRKEDLVICAALYAVMPLMYLENLNKK